MAASPNLKIYSPDGEYEGCCKHYEVAAAMIACFADGATVRLGHRKADLLWLEGTDGAAAESYDAAAQVMAERHKAIIAIWRK